MNFLDGFSVQPENVNVNIKQNNDIVFIALEMPDGQKTGKIKLKWRLPHIDVFSMWKPSANNTYGIFPQWMKSESNKSKLVSNAPVFALLAQSGMNAVTIAAADAKNSVTIGGGVREEDAHIYCYVEIDVSRENEYSTVIRADYRKIPYNQSLADVEKWWCEAGMSPMNMPAEAKLPMYSTWYAFHQNLSTQALIEQCRLAHELGMESIIIDDGWQTEDNNRGYAYCGDWKLAVSKIPDMRELTDEIHRLGMKVMIWFSLPFIGEKSENYENFKDKFICKGNSGSFCLDPRLPEVRQHLVKTYCDAVKDWNLDGLKLDFLDWYNCEEYGSADGQDTDVLEDAVVKLIETLSSELTKINPDIMIEFRQYYMGPLMRKYSNLMRVADCPQSAVFNRTQSINLRLVCGNSAVHSDMLMWNLKDTAQGAAKQLISVLFAVPQISVPIEKLSEEHYSMLKFYLKFWLDNRDALIDGELEPLHPENGYSVVNSYSDTKQVSVCYGDNNVKFNESRELYAVNGTSEQYIAVLCDENTYALCTVYDCCGEIIQQEKRSVGVITKFDVPESGVLSIKRI